MGNEYVVIDSCFLQLSVTHIFYLSVCRCRAMLIQFSFISNLQSAARKGISLIYLSLLSSTKIFSQTDAVHNLHKLEPNNNSGKLC